jgi:error-prone DNA polymerase
VLHDKLEVVVIPVSDVDRAKRFCGGGVEGLDADITGDEFRVIQFTPTGSLCSIVFGNTRVSMIRVELDVPACSAKATSSIWSLGILGTLSEDLASVGERDAGFRLPHGRGDEFHHGSPTPDPRGLPPRGTKPRDIYVPDRHIDTIKVKPRDFR